MKRREFIAVMGSAAALPFAARAQQRPASIAFLGGGAADPSVPLIEALKQGLRENGLIEGKDYVLELRWAEGHYERLPMFARELADHGARVIIVSTIAAARAAQRDNSVIPIVMATMNDPVGNRLIATLARPGGNTTGLATLNEDVTPSFRRRPPLQFCLIRQIRQTYCFWIMFEFRVHLEASRSRISR
jgi:putative ABC transport system substrate-binding protein